MTETWAPPPGFVESKTRGAFTTHNGPLYHKIDGDAFWHGFHALPRHCNGVGIVHGGWLSSFADGVLATAVWRSTETRSVTLRLNVDFLDMVRPGRVGRGHGRSHAGDSGARLCTGRCPVCRATGAVSRRRLQAHAPQGRLALKRRVRPAHRDGACLRNRGPMRSMRLVQMPPLKSSGRRAMSSSESMPDVPTSPGP